MYHRLFNMLSQTDRDMVKKLINEMNFEALQVKMKKCKVRGTSYCISVECQVLSCDLLTGAVLPVG